ncbi:MerR family transcriptional regulator [Paenibacillus sp. J22TS3]|uniref:MerR family transcriptional regulator n=1 Tax=Paenibacillus sp. J22TS3 TaxID=2807192 RepID=UPI001B037E4A|nr:MerR family transcriptional regulator [Paenibacillus sp. J22TS3]GIP24599.1 MerR family transcriptional regulator [Paenibacillus sp. J22TS3]
MKYYSIGEASAKYNIPESTLRYYEKKGLLPLIERDHAGRRLFSEHQMALLQAVICLKNTHMPISHIRQYMAWIVEGEATIELRLDMMRKHRQRVLDEIALLTEYMPGIDAKIDRYIQQIEEERP